MPVNHSTSDNKNNGTTSSTDFPLINFVISLLFLFGYSLELPWPSGYELRLSLERSQVLIPVKAIGGRQERHPVQRCSLLQQSPNQQLGTVLAL